MKMKNCLVEQNRIEWQMFINVLFVQAWSWPAEGNQEKRGNENNCPEEN